MMSILKGVYRDTITGPPEKPEPLHAAPVMLDKPALLKYFHRSETDFDTALRHGLTATAKQGRLKHLPGGSPFFETELMWQADQVDRWVQERRDEIAELRHFVGDDR